jgi:hypothetical protein
MKPILTSELTKKASAAICATTLLVAFSVSSSEAAEAPLCAEFRQLLKSDDIGRYQLQLSAQPGDEEQYYNLDIDGDDVSDVVEGGCAASLQPADPCMLLLELSSGKKFSFSFEVDERFYLVRLKSRIYAVATTASPSGGGAHSILRLDSAGINRICSEL